MMLDPQTFRSEPVDIQWRFWKTDRFGQFDIATVAGEEWGPSPRGLAHLETALANIDALYDLALPAAESAWQALYKGPLRTRDAWSLTRLFAGDDGGLVITLYEGDYDTYGAWDISLMDGVVSGVMRRQT